MFLNLPYFENKQTDQEDEMKSLIESTISDAVTVSKEFVEENIKVFADAENAVPILKERYSELPDDLTIKDNYDYVKRACGKIAKQRTTLEKARKKLKDPFINAGKIIDREAERITSQITELEAPFKKAKSDFDNARKLREEKRIAEFEAGIEDIRSAPERMSCATSNDIEIEIERITNIDYPSFQEYEVPALKARNASLELLGMCLDRALTKEQELVAEAKELNSQDEELSLDMVYPAMPVSKLKFEHLYQCGDSNDYSFALSSISVSVEVESDEFNLMRELFADNKEVQRVMASAENNLNITFALGD